MAYPTVVLMVGVALEVNALIAIGAGDTLIGVGQLLLGVAAVVASGASLVTVVANNRKIDRSIEAVEVGTQKTVAVAAAVGTPDGTTIVEVLDELHKLLAAMHELLERIIGFEEYQHVRNHDVLNHLTALRSSVPVLAGAAERLLTRLKETPP